jgi:hypothetical protein
MLDNRRILLVALLLIPAFGCLNPSGGSGQSLPIDGQIKPPIVVGLSAEEADGGRQFLPLARQFALPQFAFAARSSNGGLLYEFLPLGDSLDRWTRLGSVHVFRVGATLDDAAQILPEYMEFLRSLADVVHETEYFPALNGGVHLIHYDAAANDYREEGLAAVWVTGPGLIVNFQVMNRGSAYTEAHVEGFWKIFSELAEPKAH